MLAIDILRGEMCTLKKKNQKTLSFTSLATTQSIIILGLITITEKKAKGTLVKLNAIVTSKISFGK